MKSKKFDFSSFVANNSVPIFFMIACFFGIWFSGLSLTFILNELVVRISRNLILVMSLIIPVVAGMGLNFALVIGAMAGQVGLIVVKILDLSGLSGLFISFLIAFPFAIIFAILAGRLFNKTKGREMITGLILGFFANGLYQLVFLVGIGTVIPINNPEIILDNGIGLKNALEFKSIQYSLDRLVERIIPYILRAITGVEYEAKMAIGGVNIPIATLFLCFLIALLVTYLLKTKLGQDFRAMGQDTQIANVAGILTERTRIIAVIISIVLAALGQIVFIQNMGTLNTYASHEQVGMFSIAAILIGGASVTKASIKNAVVGTILFHTLFIVSPNAGKNLFGDALIGEYFRVFIAYGIIALSLVLHAWQKRVAADNAAKLLVNESKTLNTAG